MRSTMDKPTPPDTVTLLQPTQTIFSKIKTDSFAYLRDPANEAYQVSLPRHHPRALSRGWISCHQARGV